VVSGEWETADELKADSRLLDKLYDISLPPSPVRRVAQEFISKTQRKKQVTALQELGEKLVKLRDEQLAAIDLPENLRDAVLAARVIGTFEGRRRQMQYIGKLMRHVDAAPIRAAIEAQQAGPRRETAFHKRADSWRKRLLADDAALADFLREFPRADAQHLQMLMSTALRERDAGQPPRAFRQLYQALRNLIDSA
jgi:ribosome-associated protein